VDDATSEHLHPVTVVQYLELKRRFGEREVLIDPSLLHRPEEVVTQPLERLLEVRSHEGAPLARQPLLAAHRAADEGRAE